MRTIVNLEERQISILSEICAKENISRAEIIRRAVDVYIKQQVNKKEAFKKVFGLWKDKDIDGLKYQSQLRKEW